jgi:hypothetical protein
VTEWAWASSVDELLRLRKKSGGEQADVSYRSDARRALAGRWVGRYAQSVVFTRPAWMDVHFDVRTGREGEELFGKGTDGVGAFTIDGMLPANDVGIRLSKRYVGAHLVFYNGLVEDRSIRGVWAISTTNFGLFAFHHADDLDRSCLPRRRGFFGRLWSRAFHSEPAIDGHRHRKLVDRFYELRPDLAHLGLP